MSYNIDWQKKKKGKKEAIWNKFLIKKEITLIILVTITS